MRSAMPAVALRRERRKSQARAFSRDGSISFGDRRISAAEFGRKMSEDSLRRNSMLSARVQLERNEYELKRRKSYLMQTGAVCITTGVIVLLFGFALDTTPLYTVSLLMIALGFLICLFRAFIGLDSPSQSHFSDYNACRIRRSSDCRKVSIANSATSYDADLAFKEVRQKERNSKDLQELETLRVAALSSVRKNSRESTAGDATVECSSGGPRLSFSHSDCGQHELVHQNHPRRVSSGDSGVDMVQPDRGNKPTTNKQHGARTLSSPNIQANIATLSRNCSLGPATSPDAASNIAIVFSSSEAV